jgi:hypothetical protein
MVRWCVKFQSLPKHPAAAPGTFDAVRDGLVDLSYVTSAVSANANDLIMQPPP